MVRLSKIQETVRQQVARLAASGLPPAALGERLMAALSVAVPGDGYRLFGIDPVTLLVNRLLAASESDAWARREWLREVYLAADPLPYIELPHLMRLGLTAVVSHDRQAHCWGYPPAVLAQLTDDAHYHAFHEIRSPVGGTLIGNFAAHGRWVAALQLYRREHTHPFRAGDVAFLRMLAPAIGQALDLAFTRERAATAAPGPDATGILVLGPDGRVQLSTPAGEGWCRLLYDIDHRDHETLPTAVWAAAATLRADEAITVGSVLVPTPGGPVRVEASYASEEGTIAVAFVPERPPAPPDVPTAWPLTAQERQIVALLVYGGSDRQIAAALSISEHTVHAHLRHAYEKLGVHSRTQLLARFFHATYADTREGEHANVALPSH